MKARFILILSFLFVSSCLVFAQKEDHVWTFCVGGGLNFSSGTPVPFSSAAMGIEAGASVADPYGNLLFYTDGQFVYTRINTVMPNGSGIMGNHSSTQGAVFAQVYGQDSVYYLFTVSAIYIDAVADLRYTIIDMRLNGGLGDVVSTSKNVLIRGNISEKILISGSCGHQWLVAHDLDSSIFYSYLISSPSPGFSTPVISNTLPGYRTWSYYSIGEMKTSKNLAQIALANWEKGTTVELFDFNAATGVVSNYRLIDSAYTHDYFYGIEFSANSKVLYVGSPKGLLQYDLSSGTPAAIRASKDTIYKSTIYGLRRGPDDMIYALSGGGFMSNYHRIRKPDIIGSGCDWEANFLPGPLSAPVTGYALGNKYIPDTLTNTDTSYNSTTLKVCKGKTANISSSGHFNNKWNDGTVAKTRTVGSSTRTYWVYSSYSCDMVIDTFHIEESETATTSAYIDTFLCPKDTIRLAAQPMLAADSFKWSDGLPDSSRAFTGTEGVFWVSAYKGCTTHTDTFTLSTGPKDSSSHTVYIKICKGDNLKLNSSIETDAYRWSTGSTTKEISVVDGGIYWVKSIKDCALLTDSFVVNTQVYEVKAATLDTVVCLSTDSVLIKAPTGYEEYLWSGGNTGTDTILYDASEFLLFATNKRLCKKLNLSYDVSFIDLQPRIKRETTCNEDTIVLDATFSHPQTRYQWSTGDTSARIKVNKPGSKYVFIIVSGCSTVDSFYIDKKVLNADIGEDRKVCMNENSTLISCDIDNAEFLWNTGETSASIIVKGSGNYGVSVTKDGCTVYDQINILFIPCTGCIAIPNAFSPNSDGLNDRFKPILNCPVTNYQLQVFTRWGENIFSTNNVNELWDGTFKGKALNTGVYYYLLNIQFENGEAQMFKGDINLIY